MRNRSKREALVASVLAVICTVMLTFGAISAEGQTKKKKKRTTTRRPAAAKTTSPTSGNATVISLADQYQDGSSQIIQPSAKPATSPEIILPDDTARKLRDLQTRIKKLETTPKDDYEEKQKRLLMNLDILTKAEQRAESLRKQRFEMVEKENSIRQRLDQIEIELRPESIDRNVAVLGSLRPEEVRDARRRSLEAERRNLQTLLNDIVATRSNLDQNVLRADAMVEKLRTKLEKDIDEAIDSKEPDQ
jgi:hypothetical protein